MSGSSAGTARLETRSPQMGSVNTSQTIVKQGVTPNGNGARGRDLGPARIAMKIHTGEPIHGASHHKTEAPLGVLELSRRSTRERETERETQSSAPHMTYDRRRSCSAPRDDWSRRLVQDPAVPRFVNASSPLPCAPAPLSAARRLLRSHLHIRVCNERCVVCVSDRPLSPKPCTSTTAPLLHIMAAAAAVGSARSGQRSAEQ